jgi:hypothetical protein
LSILTATCSPLCTKHKTRLANVRVYVKVLKVCRLSYFLSVCAVSICLSISLRRSMFAFLSRFYSCALFTRPKSPNLSFSFKDTPKYIFSGGNKGTDICASLRPCNTKMTNENMEASMTPPARTLHVNKIDTQFFAQKHVHIQ